MRIVNETLPIKLTHTFALKTALNNTPNMAKSSCVDI